MGRARLNDKKTVKATLVNDSNPVSDYKNLVLRDGQRIRLEIGS